MDLRNKGRCMGKLRWRHDNDNRLMGTIFGIYAMLSCLKNARVSMQEMFHHMGIHILLWNPESPSTYVARQQCCNGVFTYNNSIP